MRRPRVLATAAGGRVCGGRSSLWGEGDEAQLLESYLKLILHSRKQSLSAHSYFRQYYFSASKFRGGPYALLEVFW